MFPYLQHRLITHCCCFFRIFSRFRVLLVLFSWNLRNLCRFKGLRSFRFGPRWNSIGLLCYSGGLLFSSWLGNFDLVLLGVRMPVLLGIVVVRVKAKAREFEVKSVTVGKQAFATARTAIEVPFTRKVTKTINSVTWTFTATKARN